MHIVNYNNYQFELTEEALLIKPIRDLFNNDKSKNKEKAMQQLSLIYFLVDPRSSYSYILNEDDRLKEIIRQEGLSNDFKIDSKLQSAIDEYKIHTTTQSSLLLQDLEILLEKLRKSLREIDFEEASDLKEKVNAIKTANSVIDQLPGTILKIQNVKKLVNSEIEEKGRARGGNDAKSLFDDGINLD